MSAQTTLISYHKNADVANTNPRIVVSNIQKKIPHIGIVVVSSSVIKRFLFHYLTAMCGRKVLRVSGWGDILYY